MSIVRLSVLKDVVYAPDAVGNLRMSDYDRGERVGRLGPLAEPEIAPTNSGLHHYLSTGVESAASNLSATQPVAILVHGFLFDPKQSISPDPKETDNPHGRIYHFKTGDVREEQRHNTSSWPVGLGFDEADDTGETGLAVAFGWHSQPGFASSLIDHFQNFYARAYDNAGHSAWGLVNVIAELIELLPERRIDLFCHSLGSRVVVRAIALAAKHQLTDVIEHLGVVIILGGAEYVVETQLMHRRLDDLELESRPVFYNVVSRENDVLDKLGENFGPRTFGNSQVIGHNGLDIETPIDHWIDLQIDKARLQVWMAERGYEISGDRPGNVWDHWYYFTHRGNMALYRDIIRQRADWHIPTLRDSDVPDRVSRDWSLFGD